MNDEQVNYFNSEEKFCSACIADGTALQVKEIVFQPPVMDMQTQISRERRTVMLTKTPGCSAEFWQCDENIWPICCEDYCLYEGKSKYGEHIFSCLHCHNKINFCADTF